MKHFLAMLPTALPSPFSLQNNLRACQKQFRKCCFMVKLPFLLVAPYIFISFSKDKWIETLSHSDFYKYAIKDDLTLIANACTPFTDSLWTQIVVVSPRTCWGGSSRERWNVRQHWEQQLGGRRLSTSPLHKPWYLRGHGWGVKVSFTVPLTYSNLPPL